MVDITGVVPELKDLIDRMDAAAIQHGSISVKIATALAYTIFALGSCWMLYTLKSTDTKLVAIIQNLSLIISSMCRLFIREWAYCVLRFVDTWFLEDSETRKQEAILAMETDCTGLSLVASIIKISKTTNRRVIKHFFTVGFLVGCIIIAYSLHLFGEEETRKTGYGEILYIALNTLFTLYSFLPYNVLFLEWIWLYYFWGRLGRIFSLGMILHLLRHPTEQQ